MNIHLPRIGLLLALLLPLFAARAEPATTHWMDGSQRRPLWVEPQWLAEQRDGSLASVPAAPLAGARLVEGDTALRLWQLPAGLSAATALAQMTAAQRLTYSVVWRDTAQPGAPWRVAAAEVFLFLDPALSTQQADTLLRTLDVVLIRPLAFGRNAYLVQAPAAGQAAVSLANRLAAQPGVAIASPNWITAIRPH